MKKLFAAVMVLMIPLFISTGVGALTIDDTQGASGAYYGGTVVNYNSAQDVIGAPYFSVDSLSASKDGNGNIEVTLSGYYFGTNYANANNGVGKPGDLYISSTGWVVSNPGLDGHGQNDTFNISSEKWDYVISYADQKLYQLTSGYTPTGNENNYWYGYRSDQAYRGGYGNVVSTGPITVTLDPASKTLTFVFPDQGWDPDMIGYHWTMACGNDVVEGGGTPVPEPGSMLLLGLGIAGLGVCGRRAVRK